MSASMQVTVIGIPSFTAGGGVNAERDLSADTWAHADTALRQ
jgi:hypothetical protein